MGLTVQTCNLHNEFYAISLPDIEILKQYQGE